LTVNGGAAVDELAVPEVRTAKSRDCGGGVAEPEVAVHIASVAGVLQECRPGNARRMRAGTQNLAYAVIAITREHNGAIAAALAGERAGKGYFSSGRVCRLDH